MTNAAETPVQYVVRFPAPETHYAEIEAVFPSSSAGNVELFLPVWTPGSYLVREYARNLENVTATGPGGQSLPIQKTRKNRWTVIVSNPIPVTIHYRVYCRELTVRTNWVDGEFALLNGAATFLTEVGKMDREHDVRLELPASWKIAISGMDQTNPSSFSAPDYDTLVDSPILAGNPAVHEFEVAGKKHYLVNQGETPFWDAPRSVRDTERIVEQNLKLWGSLPYDKYVFLNVQTGQGGGGIEHKNSTTLMTGRYATRTHKAYLGWLDLVSHEYFHLWNVKRLRPIELGPFDYENEVYTRALWLAEGWTEYYAALNLRRAGLATDAEYLGLAPAGGPDAWSGSLGATIKSVQTSPGRLVQPLALASFDAWIKTYRPDENSTNTTISYYSKGAYLAWLLDAHLQAATNGKKRLDDLMRLIYSRYSSAHGYRIDDVVAAAGEIAGKDLHAWFEQHLNTTTDFDTTEALNWFGLEFRPADTPKSDGRPKAWTGIQTRNGSGSLIVSQIVRGTPGDRAGISVDDEILAVDGWRVTPEAWGQRLEQYAPGDTITLLVSRRDRIISVSLPLDTEPGNAWQLQIAARATPEQKQHLANWLKN